MWPSCLIYCLHLWRKVKASSTRIRTFWNPQIFLCEFKNSTFTLFRIQIEFARPHLDSLWVRQLNCKSMFGSCENFIANLLQWLFHRRNCPTKHYFTRLTCLRRPNLPIRKKLQNVEAPFCIIEVYSKHKLIAHTLEDLKLKCKKWRSDNIVLGTVLLYILW